MDAAKSKTLNRTLRITFSLAHAIFIVFTVVFVYVIYGETRLPNAWFLLILLTIVSFFLAFFLNMITQYLACSKLNVKQLASSSAIPAGITAAITLTLGMFPIVESVVYTILPESLTPIYKKAISQGFYLFWGGLYGQAISSGFSQICST